MSIEVNFGSKRIVEPGVYAQTKGATTIKPSNFPFGNVLLIDTGKGAGWGGGAGINGELAKGLNSVYSFDGLSDFRNFMKGGEIWDYSEYIFNPLRGAGAPQSVSIVRAADTTAAKIALTFGAIGNVTFIAKNEGTVGNGVKNTAADDIYKGYAATVRVSDEDPAKFVVEFFQGTYSGETTGGYIYGRLSKEIVKSVKVAQSPSISTIEELITWAQTDNSLNKAFKLATGGAVAGAIVAGDVVSLKLATGGTETYTPAALDLVLEAVREFGNTFFLSTDYGADAGNASNLKILDHILTDSEFDKFLIVGAGIDDTQLQLSMDTAKSYDSARVIVVHGGNFRIDNTTGRTIELPAIYHAANVAGRLGGLAPEEPITFKSLRIDNFIHELTVKERVKALQAGVLHSRNVVGMGNVVNQGINTLQNNSNQEILPDGTSFEISIMSIGAQLNKELILNLRPLFVGGNRGRVTREDVKSFVESYLLSKSSKGDGESTLIIKSENITVELSQGSYAINYNYVPNGPINKLFVTGFMLDTNL